MPLGFKFITADLIHAEDGKVYFTELCPPLACYLHNPQTRAEQLIFMSRSSPCKFKLLQPPFEPEWVNPSYYRIFGEHALAGGLASGLIPKREVRGYLHKIFTNHPEARASIWVTYYRDRNINTPSFEFAILLDKILERINSTAMVFEASHLGYACEQNKVLFWQLLKLYKSDLMIPKEIFRFSNFDDPQRQKLAGFLTNQISEKYIIKPTDSSLTQGAIVVEKSKIKSLVELMFNAIRLNVSSDIAYQLIKNLLYPKLAEASQLVQDIVDATVKKFAAYWLRIDSSMILGSEYDFFLVETYKEPLNETEPSLGRNVAAASRCCFGVANMPEIPMDGPLVYFPEGKRHFRLEEIHDPNGYISNVSLAETLYTTELISRKKSSITGYFDRQSPSYGAKLRMIFTSPKEQAWVRALTDMFVSEFLVKIRASAHNNPELLAYLSASSVTNLNLESKEFCWNCFKMAEGLKHCVSCKQAHYCGDECQKADWKAFHSQECSKLPVRK